MSLITGIPGVISAHPMAEDPGDWRRHNDVAQLDRAEALAQDAFRKVSPFNNGTAQDKFLAQSELLQAQIIRKQVEKDLTPSQQQALEQINNEERQAVTDATAPGNSFPGNIRGGFAVAKMVDAANRSKALDNSILGVPNPPPPFPILNLPFGKIGYNASFIDGLLRSLRYRPGGCPNSRLNARLKAASDSYPTSAAISATLRGVLSSERAAT